MFTNGKRRIQKYSQQSLKCALMEVTNGTSTILGISKIYGVLRSTIQDRIHGRVSNDARKLGTWTVVWIRRETSWEMRQRSSKVWISIKAQGLINTVQTIIVDDQRPTPFWNGRTGRKWCMGFLKRHPGLSLREAEGISKERAVITEEYIKKLFNELKTFLTEQKLLKFLMIHRKYSTEMKSALVYALKPKKS